MNISTIQLTLQTVKSQFNELNHSLNRELPHFHNESLENLIAGYGLVEDLVYQQTELFNLGHSRDILELNHTVLYGSKETRDVIEYKKQLDASEKYFFERTHGGIGDLIDYYQSHSFSNPWQEASSIYIRMMSSPQLFREGNHRTGALLMSYVLLRSDLPPFVLSLQNAKEYFMFSNQIAQHARRSLMLKWRWRNLQSKFAEYLEKNASTEYLL